MADRYDGPAELYDEDRQLIGEGIAHFAIQPSPGADGSWVGEVVVKGVSEAKLLKAAYIRLPSGGEAEISVSTINEAGINDDGIAQAVSLIGLENPPF